MNASKAALAGALSLALLALPAGAAAKPRDRDGDRMPDRWERAHGLKAGKADARRDPDGDGLRNRREYRTGNDPRDSDSDGDGVGDGQEAARVVSFDGSVLVVRLLDGSELSGAVDEETEVECDDRALASRFDDEDEEDGDEEDSEDADEEDFDDEDSEDGDDEDSEEADEDDEDCGTDALVAGASIEEASLAITSAGRVWEEIELG